MENGIKIKVGRKIKERKREGRGKNLSPISIVDSGELKPMDAVRRDKSYDSVSRGYMQFKHGISTSRHCLQCRGQVCTCTRCTAYSLTTPDCNLTYVYTPSVDCALIDSCTVDCGWVSPAASQKWRRKQGVAFFSTDVCKFPTAKLLSNLCPNLKLAGSTGGGKTIANISGTDKNTDKKNGVANHRHSARL